MIYLVSLAKLVWPDDIMIKLINNSIIIIFILISLSHHRLNHIIINKIISCRYLIKDQLGCSLRKFPYSSVTISFGRLIIDISE